MRIRMAQQHEDNAEFLAALYGKGVLLCGDLEPVVLPVTAVPGGASGLVRVIEPYLNLLSIIRYGDFPRLQHGCHTPRSLLATGIKAKIGSDTPGRLAIAVRPAVRQPLGIVVNAQRRTSSNITVLLL